MSGHATAQEKNRTSGTVSWKYDYHPREDPRRRSPSRRLHTTRREGTPRRHRSRPARLLDADCRWRDLGGYRRRPVGLELVFSTLGPVCGHDGAGMVTAAHQASLVDAAVPVRPNPHLLGGPVGRQLLCTVGHMGSLVVAGEPLADTYASRTAPHFHVVLPQDGIAMTKRGAALIRRTPPE